MCTKSNLYDIPSITYEPYTNKVFDDMMKANEKANKNEINHSSSNSECLCRKCKEMLSSFTIFCDKCGNKLRPRRHNRVSLIDIRIRWWHLRYCITCNNNSIYKFDLLKHMRKYKYVLNHIF